MHPHMIRSTEQSVLHARSTPQLRVAPPTWGVCRPWRALLVMRACTCGTCIMVAAAMAAGLTGQSAGIWLQIAKDRTASCVARYGHASKYWLMCCTGRVIFTRAGCRAVVSQSERRPLPFLSNALSSTPRAPTRFSSYSDSNECVKPIGTRLRFPCRACNVRCTPVLTTSLATGTAVASNAFLGNTFVCM